MHAERTIIAATGDRPAFRIHHQNTHQQVVLQLDAAPGVFIQPHTGHPGELPTQRLGQPTFTEGHPLQRRPNEVRYRYEVLAQGLGQPPHQRHALVVDQSRDQPVQPLLRQLSQQRKRHGQGNAIRFVAGFEVIAQRQNRPLPPQRIGVLRGADLVGFPLQQILTGHVEQIGLLSAGALEPALETRQLIDVFRHPLVEIAVQGFLIDQDVPFAGLCLQRIQFLKQGLIGAIEGGAAMPLAQHQRLANEDFPRRNRIDRSEMHLAPGHDDQSEQGNLLERHHLAAALLPVRFTVAGFAQMSRQGLDPQRIDTGSQPPEQPTGLGQLGHHHPGRTLLRQRGGRVQHEPALAGTHVVTVLGLVTQMAQQSGKQRLVHRVVTGGLAVYIQSQIATGQQQLPMGLAPFAQAQVVEKVLPTPAAQLVLGQRLALLLESTPEIDEGRKIGVFIPPLGMGLIGRLLTFDRSFPRVLHRQGAGDDQHLVQTAEPGCFHQHPADARVHRQPRQLPAFLSDAAVPLDRTELLQEVEAVADGAAFRWLDEGEILDPAQPQMQHLQDHRRQVGTQDLRVGKGRAAVEVLFAVQSNADTGRHPTATSLALVRAGLRYRLDRQPLYLRTRTVTADAHLTGINHVDDTRHGK